MQQFGRHLPTACRAEPRAHLVVVLVPCFPNRSRWENTLNWWKYCSNKVLCVNCCHCICGTMCRVDTLWITTWCQNLWRLSTRHVDFVTSYVHDVYLSTFHVGICFKKCAGEEWWWECTDTDKEGWWEYTHTDKIFPIYPDIETWQELLRGLTCDNDIYWHVGKYGTWVSYEEWPEDWRVHFERGDSGSDSVTERKRLHLSILANCSQ